MIPAFWREHYRRLENFDLAALVDIVFRELGLLVTSSFGFRRLALQEITKYFRRNIIRLLSSTLPCFRCGVLCCKPRPGGEVLILSY